MAGNIHTRENLLCQALRRRKGHGNHRRVGTQAVVPRAAPKLLFMAVLCATHASNFAQTLPAPVSELEKVRNAIKADEIDRERPNSVPLKYPLPPIDPKQVEPPTPMVMRESVAVQEPFLQFKRVELENLVQDYGDRLDKERIPVTKAP